MAKREKKSGGTMWPRPSILWVYALIGAFILGWWLFAEDNAKPQKSDWMAVEAMIRDGEVEKIVVVNRDQAQVFLREGAVARYRAAKDKQLHRMPETGPQLVFTIGSVDLFDKDLKAVEEAAERNIPVVYENRENGWSSILVNLLPWVLIIGVWFFIMRSMSRGGGAGAGGAAGVAGCS